jgi:ribonuclease HI/probable phosphoglycerate mutase
VVVRTDGAARGNPGPAAAGAVVEALDGHGRARRLAEISEALGVTTNNVAEYVALVLALEEAARLGAAEVELFLDSQLIVEQLHGRYRVRDQKLIPLHRAVMSRLSGFRRWTARHVPRAQNTAADALANAALDSGARPSARALRWVPAGLFDRE